MTFLFLNFIIDLILYFYSQWQTMIRSGASAACPSRDTTPGCPRSSIVSAPSPSAKAASSSTETPSPAGDPGLPPRQTHPGDQINQSYITRKIFETL